MDITINGKKFPTHEIHRNRLSEQGKEYYGKDVSLVSIHGELSPLFCQISPRLLAVTFFVTGEVDLGAPIGSTRGFLRYYEEGRGIHLVPWKYLPARGYTLQDQPRFLLHGGMSCGATIQLCLSLLGRKPPRKLSLVTLVDKRNLDLASKAFGDAIDDETIEAIREFWKKNVGEKNGMPR